MSRASVEIVMLSADQAELTIAALASFDQQGWPAAVLLLSNGTPRDAALVSSAFEERSGTDLRIVTSATNLGCPGGRNYLSTMSDADWLLFVDNDVLFTGEIVAFVNYLSESDANLAYPIVLHPDGSVATAGGRYRSWLSWSSNGFYRQPLEAARTSLDQACDWGGGACLAIRRKVFVGLDGFAVADHSTYGAADLDLCLRANAAGFAGRRVPYAPITHLDEGTGRTPVLKRRALAAGARAIRRRHGSKPTRLFAACWFYARRLRSDIRAAFTGE